VAMCRARCCIMRSNLATVLTSENNHCLVRRASHMFCAMLDNVRLHNTTP